MPQMDVVQDSGTIDRELKQIWWHRVKKLTKRSLVWVGALGSVASILGFLAIFFTDSVNESQSAVVTGDDSNVFQIQNDSLESVESQHQDATVKGHRSTVLQRQ